MKRKAWVFTIILIAIAAVWYFTPKTFAEGIAAADIDRFTVFDGHTGTAFDVDDPVYISMIVRNLQNTPMKRGSISLGRMGYWFSVEGLNENGKTVMPKIIINSDTTIRKDPFFYTCGGGLCVDFLEELETEYLKTQKPTGEGTIICIDGVYYVDTGEAVPAEPDESAIEYVEIPVGGSASISAFARINDRGDTYLLCLINGEWYKFMEASS